MIILIVSSCLLNILLGYLVWNLNKKVNVYEQSINEFYSQLSIALHTMRIIDAKQMFENDDEVGEVFNQLNDILFQLRPILYGQETDEEKN